MMGPTTSKQVDAVAVRTRLALGLALLLVVAGCTGGGGSPTATPTDRPEAPTTTPTEATVAVPDIVDETEQDGLDALDDAGLAAGDRTRTFSDDIDRGRIVRTDPRAGVIVARGTAVDYVLSRGPEPTPTPTPRRTARPTARRTARPTPKPTQKPTAKPTAKPTEAPTAAPTAAATAEPTSPPTAEPTSPPTAVPTAALPSAPAAIPLPGTAWVLTDTIEDASTDVALPDGLLFTADFDDTHVSGTVVCNQFSAPYTAAEGGGISIGEVAVTAMACADDDGTAQTQYLDALRASTSYQASAMRLVLTADDGTRLVYAPAPPAPSPSLPPG
jgi:heat shock protein HslJ